MKTITIRLTENESTLLQDLARTLDPSGSITPTTVASACLIEGLVRNCIRNDVLIPSGQYDALAQRRYLGKLAKE